MYTSALPRVMRQQQWDPLAPPSGEDIQTCDSVSRMDIDMERECSNMVYALKAERLAAAGTQGQKCLRVATRHAAEARLEPVGQIRREHHRMMTALRRAKETPEKARRRREKARRREANRRALETEEETQRRREEGRKREAARRAAQRAKQTTVEPSQQQQQQQQQQHGCGRATLSQSKVTGEEDKSQQAALVEANGDYLERECDESAVYVLRIVPFLELGHLKSSKNS